MKPAQYVPALILSFLLVCSVTAYSGPFSSITGAAIAAPDHMDFSLYEGERDVGTANPGSNGQARAIAAGQTMRILLDDVRYDGQTVLRGVVSILIRQGNVDMVTLTAVITDGTGTILFEIPSDWDKNYHMEATLEGTDLVEQNEFKVDGSVCVPRGEMCDGKDNDCDGRIDDGISCACIVGQTQSCGSGGCLRGTRTCDNGAWTVCSDVTGPQPESCNSIDDNCDGRTDEGLARTCGIGGVQQCTDGAWGTCPEGPQPQPETCNAIDDDLDGIVDDGIDCSCTDGQTSPCGSTTGQCTIGTRICVDGSWGACSDAVMPTNEMCNGLDDDCDGVADDGIVLACGKSDTAPCSLGVRLCVDGALTACQGNLDPSSETCDTRDNDCDGFVDENVCQCAPGSQRSCPAVGACSGAVQSCDNGIWGECRGGILPELEICDGVDNDCNGQVDEDITRSCGSSIGMCAAGQQTCSTGLWGACTKAKEPSQEVCNGVDDDCDGSTDDGISCSCMDGQERSCGTDTGQCRVGTQICNGGRWGICDGTGPGPEICDNKDNDCNGLIDDSLSRSCGQSDVGACMLGTELCTKGSWSTCDGRIDPATEVCDDIDNNCDGRTDEFCPVNPGPLIAVSDKKKTSPVPVSENKGNSGVVSDKGKRKGFAQLEVRIVGIPQAIEAQDSAFGVQAIIRNNGSLVLPNVVVDGTVAGWRALSENIGSLDPGESKPVTLTFGNQICTNSTPPQKLPDSVSVTVRGHSGDIADQKTVDRNVRAPPIGVLLSASADNLRTCILIGNKDKPARGKIDVELEVYDRDQDHIVDLISPIKVGANETFLSVHDYSLSSLDTPKLYKVRVNMFENGTVFTRGYQVAQARASIDLSDATLPARYTLMDLIKRFAEVFA